MSGKKESKKTLLATPMPDSEIVKFDAIAQLGGRTRAAELRILAREHIKGGKPVQV